MAARMIRRAVGAIGLAAFCAALLVLALGAAAAQGEQLRIAVDDDTVLADGGSARVTIRLAADVAGADTTITITSDLGAFGADSGPSRVIVRPSLSGSGDLVAAVTLVGDGRPGLAVVTARAGLMVDAVTVAFIGAPAEIAILRPTPERPLDASRSHVVQIEVRDRLGQPVPGAPLRLEATSADGDPVLRAADGSSGSLLALRSSERGRVSATVSAAAPGAATLRAVSVDAAAELALAFHGEPVSLRLWALTPVMERGSETAAAIVLARLLDAGGRAVPGQRVSFAAQDDSGIRLSADSELDELITDAAGGVLVQATTDAARSGDYWLRADAEGSGLSDIIELTVVGTPETTYVTAALVDMLESSDRSGAEVREYILRAEVVDATGRLSASGYTVRWRVVLEEGEAELTPENSIVRRGVATSRLRIERAVGAAGGAPVLQAWLIENPQEVSASGLLADLAGSGLALAKGMNVVTWVGADKSIADAIAPIGHLDVTVWRQHPGGTGWQVYTTQRDAPVKEAFQVANGDRLHIRMDAAARLPGATR